MISIPISATPGPFDHTAVLSPHGTQQTPWPDPYELHTRGRTARLQARLLGATRPGVAKDSDKIPPGLANALWQWAWGNADTNISEIAIVLVSRWECCYWQGRRFRLPSVEDYLEARAE